jgi:steroid 5-alpha reductase family enzyme
MWNQIIQIAASSLAALVVLETMLWSVNVRKKNGAVVDVGWGTGFVIVVLIALLVADGFAVRKLLVAAMVSVWGLRLSLHLLFDRILANKPEDGRYVEMRKKWGKAVNRRFFWFFRVQGVLIVLFSLPFLLAMVNAETTLHSLEYIGAAVWGVGLIGESAADRQLRRFKDDTTNKGKTCRVGLWNYSRHPNYFFEWIIWVGYAVVALASPYGWLGIFSPLAMLYILLNVTGIPLTEEQALRSRGEDYREYQRTTSKFIPWFRHA